MKVCIYGMGAIGCWLAVKLSQAGHEVITIAQGQTREVIAREGITLHEGTVTHNVNVACYEDPAELPHQDYVFVTVKSHSMASVARKIAPLMQKDTVAVSLQNGIPWWFCRGLSAPFSQRILTSIDPDGSILRAMPAESVIGGVVHVSCIREALAVSRLHKGNVLVLGEALGNSSERNERLVALLNHAGIDARISPKIHQDVWYKLWGNMTMNPIGTLTGATTDRILNDELLFPFVSNVIREAERIGNALNINPQQSVEELLTLAKSMGAMTTSMLQDSRAKRPLEIDALLSSIHELGIITAIETPFLSSLLGLVKLYAMENGLYPSHTTHDLPASDSPL
ncbi:hypothetical protein ED28_04655 [[Pantoea] beijingensis]|uniref:2-dehydropantoate 2-reductase n=1 Tax=[Pantoea] beijingensis TaxID=1324864 RepID=A0A443IGC8_9GAMM|nr:MULTISPECIES: 2-dehydropantoate 2-reductase [Erwiniaceae]RWR03092.1 hypothetical protein ED28_04655 [[Pantoea] beijingensis]